MVEQKVSVDKLLDSVPEYIQKVKCDTTIQTNPFKCAVLSCENSFVNAGEHKIAPFKFHNFPSNPMLCLKWKSLCGLDSVTDISNVKVCSDHFSLDDYVRNYKQEFLNKEFKRELKPNACPNLNIDPKFMICAVYGCPNSVPNNDAQVQYYPFPKLPEFSDLWIQLTGWQKGEINLKTARVCSIHFSSNESCTQFVTQSNELLYKILKEDAIPTLFLPRIQANDENLDERMTQVHLYIEKDAGNDDVILRIQENNGSLQVIEETSNEKPLFQIGEAFTVHDKDMEMGFEHKEKISVEYTGLEMYQVDDDNITTTNPDLPTTSRLSTSDNSAEHQNKHISELLADQRILQDQLEKQQKLQYELRETLNKLKHKEKKLDEDFNLLSQQSLKQRSGGYSSKSLLEKVFSPCQIKILMGRQKTYWSSGDMCVSYTLLHLSNRRCYQYISKKLKYPLVPISSLVKWARDCRKRKRRDSISKRNGKVGNTVDNAVEMKSVVTDKDDVQRSAES